MESKFNDFLEEHIQTVRDIEKELSLASWDFERTGKEEWKNKLVEKEKELFRIYANKEYYQKLKDVEKSGEITDPILKRQLTLLVNAFESQQYDEEIVNKIISLNVEVTDKFNNHRGHVDGKKLNNNEISKILKDSNDNELRKKAWFASKEIGELVAEQILEIVHLRNESARNLGYSNYYEKSLKLDEIHQDELFEIFDRLKELTDEPFRAEKQILDEGLAKRFNVSVDELRPWHYSDPFFQEKPVSDGIKIDHFFEDKDAVDLNIKFYDGIGLEVRDILDRSDLYPKDGKSQHAFCTHIDKKGDVRILCNIEPSEYWTCTVLHELGHAVYDKYLDLELPYLLREPAHIMSTEAIAMLMGRFTKNNSFLEEIVGVSKNEIQKVDKLIKNEARMAMLIFVRWGLTMVNFERALYENPDQDLNKLWWDCVEKYQFLKRPEGRNKADWASKIHFAMAPVYYHNYVLGELIVSQISQHMRNSLNGQIVNNKETGKFLVENIFRHGSKYHWNEMLEVSIGEKLNPEYFIHEFIKV